MPVPPRTIELGEVKDMQVFRGKPCRPYATLADHHAAHSSGCMRGPRRRRLPLRHRLLPLPAPDVHYVYITRGSRESDACKVDLI